MKEISILAPAKINLSIDILNKRTDGYHSVEMILQAIDLYDTITVKKIKSGLSVGCSHPRIPEDCSNIAFKAAEKFFAKSGCEGGAQISIKKAIPISAGLGGGSADGASVLKALNILYDHCLEDNLIFDISKSLGADVAFFLNGGTQLAKGIGEELTELPDLEGINLILVNPDFPVSTRWVYQNLELNNISERPNINSIIDSIKKKDINNLALNMQNVLESVTLKKYPVIFRIIEKLIEYGALGSRMSGSGPTVFGIFADESTAKAAKTELQKEYTHVYHNKTIGRESF